MVSVRELALARPVQSAMAMAGGEETGRVIMLALYIFGVAIILLLAWRIGLSVYAVTRQTLHELRLLDVDLQWSKRRLQAPSTFYPNEAGSYPMLLDAQSERILDPDRGLVFDRDGLLTASPEVHRWSALRRVVQSLQVNIGNEAAGKLLEAPAQHVQWPEMVDLRGLFVNRQATINDLVVGVTYDESGQKVLSASIHDLMHVLAVGASGWGKSSWLRALVWQLARASELVEVVAIDVSGSEFNALHSWGKLRYPVARESGQASALLEEVCQEVGRRKELYGAYPLASNLPEYNGLAADPLTPWVILVDEGTALLNESDIGKHLRRGVQTARQYGLYFVVTGQSANHRVIETQTRDQFSTRLCFRTSPTSSRVVLDDGAASNINAKGRAWVQLVGRELCEIQGAFITKEELAKVLTNHGPRYPMPEVPPSGNGDQAARIRELADQGYSKRQICLDVFGYTGGAAFEQVSKVLDGTTTI